MSSRHADRYWIAGLQVANGFIDLIQILRQGHAPLLELLGKTSGFEVDKLVELAAKGIKLTERFGVRTLQGGLSASLVNDVDLEQHATSGICWVLICCFSITREAAGQAWRPGPFLRWPGYCPGSLTGWRLPTQDVGIPLVSRV